jgi:transposase
MIRTMLMPKEPTWWIWLGTAQLLSLGLAGVDHAFLIGIFLSVAQTAYFLLKHRSPSFTARARLRRGIRMAGTPARSRHLVFPEDLVRIPF